MNPRDIKLSNFYRMVTQSDRIKFLLSYAVLAPSTHNSQPWLFKIENNVCKVYYDPKYLIPVGDPLTRDLHISIGCAVENLNIAAKYFGMAPIVNLGPFEEKNLLAKIIFSEPANKLDNYGNLLNTIPKRINARGVFQKTEINLSTLDEVKSEMQKSGYTDNLTLHLIVDRDKINSLARLTARGLRMAYQKPIFRREMSRWMNNSLSPKKEGLHGYALKMPLFLSFIIPTLVRLKDIGPFLADKNYQSISSAPLLVVISAKKNDPHTWLETGLLAERLMLEFQSQD